MGYYCLRVAAELTRGREFNPSEKKIFKNRFVKQCADVGATLHLTTVRFRKEFPNIGVFFNPKESYGMMDEFITPANIKKLLDMGKKVVLNIQNIKIGKTLQGNGSDGHNICCVGYTDTHFIFQDSNKWGRRKHGLNPCLVKMKISVLQDGYKKLHEAKDLDERIRIMRKTTHVTEMYVADTEEKVPQFQQRRSSRRR